MITINNKQFKTILFDKDGTLFDSEQFSIDVRMACAKKMNISLTEDVLLKCIGKSGPVCKGIMQEALEPEYSYDEFIKQARIDEKIEEERRGVPMRSGVRHFVEHLREKHVQMAVVTSSMRKSAEKRLREHNLIDAFETIVAIEDVENPKPHAEPYLIALKRLGAKKDETLVFEDSPSGVKSALSAGLQVVFVRDLVELPEELERHVFLSIDSWEMLGMHLG